VFNEPNLRDGLKAGGAPVMWERVVREALTTMGGLVPPGSQVLEVGYGDGLLTCFLCQELGWQVVGLEVDRQAQLLAEQHAVHYGLANRVEFRFCASDKTRSHSGQYDAVFIKTVLLYSSTLAEYDRWLDWILSVLRPGGVFISFETGRANALTQGYRRLRRRSYTDVCLYTSQVEALYDAHFDIIDRRCYGGLSQFLAPVPLLYHLAYRIEETLRPRHADNSFIISIIARRPG